MIWICSTRKYWILHRDQELQQNVRFRKKSLTTNSEGARGGQLLEVLVMSRKHINKYKSLRNLWNCLIIFWENPSSPKLPEAPPKLPKPPKLNWPPRAPSDYDSNHLPNFCSQLGTVKEFWHDIMAGWFLQVSGICSKPPGPSIRSLNLSFLLQTSFSRTYKSKSS